MSDKFNIKINKQTEPVTVHASNDLAELLSMEDSDGISIGDKLLLGKGLIYSNDIISIYNENANQLQMIRHSKNTAEANISSDDFWVADITNFLAMTDEVREKIGAINLIFSPDLQQLKSIELRIKNFALDPSKSSLYGYVTEELFKKTAKKWHIQYDFNENNNFGSSEMRSDYINIFTQYINAEHIFELWDKFESDEAQTAMREIVTPDAPEPEHLGL